MVSDARILIGYDSEQPDIEFVSRNISKIYTNISVDFIGKELPVDVLTATVFYAYEGPKIFKPLDFLGFKTSENQILKTNSNISDLKTVPFGTPIWFYKGSDLIAKFYLDNVVRTGIKTYELNCISAIGLLRRMVHVGGIYKGLPNETVGNILNSILVNATFPWEVDADIAALKVYGWLPYDTCANNLWQLMLAFNISILKTDDGTVRFAWFANSDPESVIDVEPSRIYTSGDLTLPSIPSSVVVTEHSYREFYYTPSGQIGTAYDDRNDYTVLFDNTEALEPADHQLVIFPNAPICLGSVCIDPGIKGSSLRIETPMGNVNHCYVSGFGRLLGVPYVHGERDYSISNQDVLEENTKSLTDVTVINLANSDFVAQRMMKYYKYAEEIANSFVLSNERCGLRYSLINPFRERAVGYLESMKINSSSKLQVESKFITEYTPVVPNTIYKHAAIIVSTAGGQSGTSGVWPVPTEVMSKPVEERRLRIIICGGGNGGEAGEDGNDGNDGTYTQANGVIKDDPKGGKGGAGGAGGDGGKIRIIELKGSSIQPSYSYTIGAGGNGGTSSSSPGVGGDSSFGEWSTSMGAQSQQYGVVCLFNNSYVLGERGTDGVKGGDGGKYEDKNGVVHMDSEGVTYTDEQHFVHNTDGVQWLGTRTATLAQHGFYGIAECGLPGGAAADGHGNQGSQPYIEAVSYRWQTQENAGYIAGGAGGDGGYPQNRGIATGLGQGGSGGHGGGGGGQGGSAAAYNYYPGNRNIYGCEDWDRSTYHFYEGGSGGIGGAGGAGHGGAIMIYY